ncbi:MAG: hypothetical protein CVU69_03145 [Deltaproteobacteria bacterium HGW-Deltaproteobacteria-4]|nr:MAG: hypothetical protein CVU69_03145 [Deltaproteobacteria bacterium HGW-Deltaproteobacteria-4]
MKKSVLAVTAMLAFLAMGSVATAATVGWDGNGTSEGVCNNVTVDPTVTGQNWLFVLTQANTAIRPELNATFNSVGKTLSPASKINRNNVQFSVNTAPYAILQSASAVEGNAKSVLTVSHCEVGVQPQWCSPGFWRNADDKAWSDAGINREEAKYSEVTDKYSYCPAADGDPTLQQVLERKQDYFASTDQGQAFNCVGDFLSDAHPNISFSDNIRALNTCPISNAGYVILP